MKKHNKILSIQGDPLNSINKKTDSTKTEEEKQPDVILEWKDE